MALRALSSTPCQPAAPPFPLPLSEWKIQRQAVQMLEELRASGRTACIATLAKSLSRICVNSAIAIRVETIERRQQ